jgi:hypothetical protein
MTVRTRRSPVIHWLTCALLASLLILAQCDDDEGDLSPVTDAVPVYGLNLVLKR